MKHAQLTFTLLFVLASSTPTITTATSAAPAPAAPVVEQAAPAKPADKAPKPPRRPPPMPDPATIPGAETRTPADFDLTDTGYVLDQGKWFAIAPGAEKGTIETKIQTGAATKFLILLDSVGENLGQSTVQIKVGETALAPQSIPACFYPTQTGPAFQLRWRDVPITDDDVISITTHLGGPEGEARSRGRWSRVIFIPLDADPRATMRGGPPSMPPPPPPPGAASSGNP